MFRMSEPNYAYERTGEVTARTRINPLVSRHGGPIRHFVCEAYHER